MHRFEAQAGTVFSVGYIPVGLASATGGRAVMYAPNCLEESEEDLRRLVALQAKRIDRRIKRRKNLRRRDGGSGSGNN